MNFEHDQKYVLKIWNGWATMQTLILSWPHRALKISTIILNWIWFSIGSQYNWHSTSRMHAHRDVSVNMCTAAFYTSCSLWVRFNSLGRANWSNPAQKWPFHGSLYLLIKSVVLICKCLFHFLNQTEEAFSRFINKEYVLAIKLPGSWSTLLYVQCFLFLNQYNFSISC